MGPMPILDGISFGVREATAMLAARIDYAKTQRLMDRVMSTPETIDVVSYYMANLLKVLTACASPAALLAAI